MPASENSPPSSSTFTSGIALVGYLALIRFLLYLFAGPHYGYFRDELYYLACGQHPAWGYVDQPPLIGWMAWLLQHTIGTSLYALRLLPVLADVATMFLTAKLARDLGGGRWAMFLAALAVLAAPIFLALTHLFTMNAFDPLLWTLLAWLLVRLKSPRAAAQSPRVVLRHLPLVPQLAFRSLRRLFLIASYRFRQPSQSVRVTA